ncbi:MAG: hypothetical protein ABIC04_00925 [Nanoarchaeota archaeon]
MTERKFSVQELRFSYNGPLDIVDFFRAVEDWIHKKGFHKDIKKKSEEVTAKGKRVEWFIEINGELADYARSVIRLRVLFKNIKDAKIELKGRKKRVQVVDALLYFDGILETDLEGRWYQKPTFYFFRAVYDKYFSHYYTQRFEAKLTADTYALYHYIMDYFNSYRE